MPIGYLFELISFIFKIYYLLLFVQILSSWVPTIRYNKFFEIVDKLTEPYLKLFRDLVPQVGMVDFSPIIAFFVLSLIENGLFRLLYLFIR